MIRKLVVNTESWGDQRDAYLYTPDDTSKKYPGVIFFPGLGETGSAEGLLVYGPLKFAQDGLLTQYVVLGVHAPAYPIDSAKAKYAFENTKAVTDLWDGGPIHYTGLSAGGFRVIEAYQKGFNGVFVPMSTSTPTSSLPANARPIWAFHADNDSGNTAYSNSKNFVDAVNAKFPNSAKLTTYHGGHSGWNQFFDPSYRESNQNIYEFGNSVIITPPIAKKLVKTIKYYDDNTYEEIKAT